jgi:phosphoadenosine phosphosulfate reductase
MQPDAIEQLESDLDGLPAHEAIKLVVSKFGDGVVFSTSFGIEDQVVTDLLAYCAQSVTFFTLDTGRLFPETYSVWSRTIEKYPIRIHAYTPNADQLNVFISENGPNSFYESVQNRKVCCNIRKVVPLKNALAGNKVWITGIRAEQSQNRDDMKRIEWDEANQIIKFHPILDWNFEQVKAYVVKHQVPYNPLHDNGFVSIGCAPCTRAIKAGEDFRAGRWWWEDNSKKECGLHTHNK